MSGKSEMSDDMKWVKQTLGHLDPLSGADDDKVSRHFQKEAILNKIKDSQEEKEKVVGLKLPSSRRRWSIGISVATAAAVAAFALVVSPSVSIPGTNQLPAYAATPELLSYGMAEGKGDARTQLLELAAKARTQPPVDLSGKYTHIKIQGWYLNSSISGGKVKSALEPAVEEMWRAADGSGWIHGGKAKPGEISRSFNEPLSGDAATFQKQIDDKYDLSMGTFESFVAIADLYRAEVLGPDVRAAALTFLANAQSDQPIEYLGEASDRIGRQGIAIATESARSGLPTRYVLIFDQNTGQLLASEQVLTKDAGKLRVKIPAVTSYSVWVESNTTNTIKK